MEPLTVERLKKANEIVKKIKLPVQPEIVIDINKEACSAEPDFRNISNLVSKDAGLSAKVLKVVNSPFFGAAVEVKSIVQALSLMGMDNFNKVILTTCLREAIGSSSKEDQVFWDHSLHTAIAAEYIGKKRNAILALENVTPDQAYMAGLFHDSAVPVCAGRSPDYAARSPFALSHKQNIVKDEEAVIGTDHCCLGAMMAKSWSLSTDICKAILHHHVSDYDTIAKDEAPAKLIASLQFADYIAYCHDYSIGNVRVLIEQDWSIEEWADNHRPVLNELQFEADEANDLKAEILDILSR